MESPRYLRIALPPFVFYGAVILGEWLNNNLHSTLAEWRDKEALLAGIIAASIVPLGFVIGGLTLLVLSTLGRIPEQWAWLRWIRVGYGRYDLLYTRDETRPLLDDLGIQDTDSSDDHLNAARTFVYEARNKWWLAEYLNRLWDASMAYSGSVLALLFAIVYVLYTCIYTSQLWWAIAVVALGVCVFMARYTRKEIRNVVTFQIGHRNLIPQAVARWRPSERNPHQTASE